MALANNASLNPNQLELVKSIINYLVNSTEDATEKERFALGLIRRKELNMASQALTGHTCNPAFISKNEYSKIGAKTKVPGEVNVSFDLMKFINYAEKHPYKPKTTTKKTAKPKTDAPAAEVAEAEAATAKPAKKTDKPKKEAVAKKTDKPVVVDSTAPAIATVE